LAFAVGVVVIAVVVTPTQAFLTVSHDVPARRPFALLVMLRR